MLGIPIPPLKVWRALHELAVLVETPPPPLIALAGIDAAGNETVPDDTVRPLAKVGVEFTVSVLLLDVPRVAFPLTVRVVAESVPSVAVPVTVMLLNVCVAVHVLAVPKLAPGE